MVHFQCASRDILSKVFCHLLLPFTSTSSNCLLFAHSGTFSCWCIFSISVCWWFSRNFNDWGLFGLSFRWISSEFNFLRTQRYYPLIGSDTPLWHARGQSEVSVLCVYVCGRGGSVWGSFERVWLSAAETEVLRCESPWSPSRGFIKVWHVFIPSIIH